MMNSLRTEGRSGSDGVINDCQSLIKRCAWQQPRGFKARIERPELQHH